MAWLAVGGCEDPESDSRCPAPGAAVALELASHQDGTPVTDGVDVPVFPPPQGGVFTELDVRLSGVDGDDLEQLRVEVRTRDTGEPLATQVYFGPGLPLVCEGDGALTITALPVGFDDAVVLEDLDGVEATLTTTVEATDEPRVDTYAITLRVTDY